MNMPNFFKFLMLHAYENCQKKLLLVICVEIRLISSSKLDSKFRVMIKTPSNDVITELT